MKRQKLLVVSIVSACCIAVVLGLRLCEASQKARPRRVTVEGKNMIEVRAGSDLQSALDSANCGDTITLQSGAVYKAPVGGFILRYKGPCTGTDADYITVRTSNLAGLAAQNTRLDPAIHSAALAKLVGTSGYHVIDTAPGAHHYKLIGLEVTTDGNPHKYTPDLIDLGSDTTRQQRIDMKGFVIDRCFIHPAEISSTNLFPSTVERTSGRGIGANVSDLWVINSYVAGFAGKYPSVSTEAGHNIDSYGVFSPVGPGPIHIINNYIEAQFNNIFLGGADPETPNMAVVSRAALAGATLSTVANLRVNDLIALKSSAATPTKWQTAKVTGISGTSITYQLLRGKLSGPSVIPDSPGEARWNGDLIRDIEIRGNTLNKPDAWNSFSNPKAWIEVKIGQNVIIDGNDMYSGVGSTMAFTVRNQYCSAPWSTIENLTFSNNRVRGYKWGFGIQLTDNEFPSVMGGNLTIHNNLFYDEKRETETGTTPQFIQIYGGHDITVTNNTILQAGAMWYSDAWPTTNFVYKDNISGSGKYGPSCFLAPGTMQTCWPNFVASNNVVLDNRDEKGQPLSALIPGMNYYLNNVSAVGFVDLAKHNYRLAPNSKYKGKGSSGRDPGVDMDALMAALGRSSQPAQASR